MAKGNTATAKGKGNTRTKAPMKVASKKAAPKKAPATQYNKNKGTWKRPAEIQSSEESSDEELDHRPCKKHARPTEASDDEVEAGDKNEDEPEVLGGEQEDGHESSDYSKV